VPVQEGSDVLEELYRAFPATFVARRNLTRNRIRSILTMLGIAIGVVAVASLGIFGNTLQADITGQLSGIGSTLVVSPAFDAGVESLSRSDVRRIDRSASEVSDPTVVPMKADFLRVEGEDSQTFARTYGTEAPGELVSAANGRIPETLRDGAVVGPKLADKLGVTVGDEVTVNGNSYRVVAVAEPARLPPSSDNAVYVPPEAVDSEGFSLVMVETGSATQANATAMGIKSEMNGREQTVEVTELADQVERIKGVFRTLNVFLTGVAAISLFVAGVGILNVMLMSAVERRQEVGVLRAVGLRRFDVLKIMLIEATLLGIFGSLVGGLISVGSGVIVNAAILDAPMRAFAPQNLVYLVGAVAFGILIGVLSGVYPAWKASRERPVEALRH
jgi:putative ABC transport system permease protein